MATLHIHDIDDDLVARLERRARQHGRSAEAEHRDILHRVLTQESVASFEELAAAVRQSITGRQHTPSEILVRETRDER